jgi:hypothetical protein
MSAFAAIVTAASDTTTQDPWLRSPADLGGSACVRRTNHPPHGLAATHDRTEGLS